MENKKLPDPGSDEAIKLGCLCPVTYVQYEFGAEDSGHETFWINGNCPLHGKELKDKWKS